MPRPPRSPCLIRLFPGEEGERLAVLRLVGEGAVLGRDDSADVVVPGEGVSRQHARVGRHGNRVFVQDLGSRNGSWLGGQRLSGDYVDWPEGTLLRLGDAVFVLRMWSEDEAAVAAMPPLPGPINTRYPPLIIALRRVQALRDDGGPLWVVGEVGSGRSVIVDHLRALQGGGGGTFVHGGDFEIHSVDSLPPGARSQRAVIIPRLQNRPEDLLLLLGQMAGQTQVRMVPRLMEALHLYDWPGNVRELRIALTRANHPRFGSMPGTPWDVADFPDVWEHELRAGRIATGPPPIAPEGGIEPEHQGRWDTADLRRLLDACHWRIYEAAQRLQMERVELLALMLELGLRGPTLGTALDLDGVPVIRLV